MCSEQAQLVQTYRYAGFFAKITLRRFLGVFIYLYIPAREAPISVYYFTKNKYVICMRHKYAHSPSSLFSIHTGTHFPSSSHKVKNHIAIWIPDTNTMPTKIGCFLFRLF